MPTKNNDVRILKIKPAYFLLIEIIFNEESLGHVLGGGGGGGDIFFGTAHHDLCEDNGKLNY